MPRILFVKEGPYLDRMCASGAEVISLGSMHDLAAARRDYPHLVFQGNVDEEILRGPERRSRCRPRSASACRRAAARGTS